MSKRITYILLICLVILFFFDAFFWLKYITNILIIFLGFPHGDINKKFYKQLPLLLLPLLLGISGIINFPLFDVVRDIYYFLIPIIFATIGYIVAKKFSSKEIVSMFIFFGILFSFLHTAIAFSKFGFHLIENFTKIRDEVTPGNSLTVISLFLLIYHKKLNLDIQISRTKYYLGLLINIVAFILSGSRTYLVILIIFLFYLIFKRIDFKKYIAILFVSFSSALILISLNVFEENSSNGELTFTNKLMSSFSEIAVNDYSNEVDIVTKYRGYEAFMALKTFTTGTIFDQVLGRGFGAMIDLEVYVQLGEGNFRFIPVLHNGFLYVLVKTGITGVIFYFIFYILIFNKVSQISLMFPLNSKLLFLNRFMKASVVSLLISNFVVSSLVNVAFEFLQIFIVALYFKIIEIESQNLQCEKYIES